MMPRRPAAAQVQPSSGGALAGTVPADAELPPVPPPLELPPLEVLPPTADGLPPSEGAPPLAAPAMGDAPPTAMPLPPLPPLPPGSGSFGVNCQEFRLKSE